MYKSDGFFIDLDDEQEKSFRSWVTLNYGDADAGSIKYGIKENTGRYHPVIIDEMQKLYEKKISEIALKREKELVEIALLIEGFKWACKYIELSPGDPDIYPDQYEAYLKFQEIKKQLEEK